MQELRTSEEFGRFTPANLQAFAIGQSMAAKDSHWGSLWRRFLLASLRTPMDVTRFGAKLRLYPKDNLCEKRALLAPHRFDPAERVILRTRFHSGFSFVDIGANVGLYSLFCTAGNEPTARILAVEPQPGIKERLQYNILINGYANITVLDCAISDKKGLARMQASQDNRGTSGFANNASGNENGQFVVQTRPLYEVLQSHKMLGADAMKIDIEGAEDQALPLFFEQATDEELPRLLIIESNTQWKVDCIEMAQAKGYHILQKTRMNHVLAL